MSEIIINPWNWVDSKRQLEEGKPQINSVYGKFSKNKLKQGVLLQQKVPTFPTQIDIGFSNQKLIVLVCYFETKKFRSE